MKRGIWGVKSDADKVSPTFVWPLLCAFLLLCFLMGGSPRSEVSSLAFLFGASALALGGAAASLSKEAARPFKLVLALLAACMLLPLMQSVPLPPGVANGLPGHQLIAEIDTKLALEESWRPLTMVPGATRSAFWFLMVPAAAMLMTLQLTVQQHKSLAFFLSCLAGLSGLIGLLQLLGDAEGWLYPYETTNNGSAVGMFANRNHQAAFLACLFPLASAWLALRVPAGRPKARARRSDMTVARLLPILGLAFVVPLLLITGSRSGLILGVIGLASIILIRRARLPGRSQKSGSANMGGVALSALIVLLLVWLTLWLQRAVAVDRLFDRDAADDMRVKILPAMREMIEVYFPWGSGMGSFEQVYQIHEPADLLASFYMNQAHNDLLDLVLTGGLPAVLLLATAVVFWLLAAAKTFAAVPRDELQPLRVAGLSILFILALASLSDYPLRTPALSCLFAIAAIWAALPFRQPASGRSFEPAANP